MIEPLSDNSPTENAEQGPSNIIPEVIPAAHIAPELPAVSPYPGQDPEIVADDPAESESATPDGKINLLSPQGSTPVKSTPLKKTTSTSVSPEFIGPTSKAIPAPRPAGDTRRKTRQKAETSTPKAPKLHLRLVTFASTVRSIGVTFAAAVIVATIFMWWTSPDFLPTPIKQELSVAQATARQVIALPTSLPTPAWFNRIGVIAGHSGIAAYGPTTGQSDPGAVCDDGFSEGSVTIKVAQQVVAELRGRGYDVDLLEEFDPRLPGYQAAAFISLHAEPCVDYGYGGFSLAASLDRPAVQSKDAVLTECMIKNYGTITGMEFQPGNVTENMTNYHAFDLKNKNISPTTPGVVLEMGYIGHDRDMLQNHTDKIALGVVNGLRCFLEPNASPTAVPVATRLPLGPPTATSANVPVSSPTLAKKP